jgi:hypothetical protein
LGGPQHFIWFLYNSGIQDDSYAFW